MCTQKIQKQSTKNIFWANKQVQQRYMVQDQYTKTVFLYTSNKHKNNFKISYL